MTYVDGFVLKVPKKNSDAYKNVAKEAGKIWKKHGALVYVECKGDDLNPSTDGAPILTFPKLTKLKKHEDVWFSFIIYKSKEHRDFVNAKVMKEMENNEDAEMPFDMKQMAWGGFEALVEKK